MKSIVIAILLTGCSAPDTYYKSGYEHTYSYNSGWKQVWSAQGSGVPCELRAN